MSNILLPQSICRSHSLVCYIQDFLNIKCLFSLLILTVLTILTNLWCFKWRVGDRGVNIFERLLRDKTKICLWLAAE